MNYRSEVLLIALERDRLQEKLAKIDKVLNNPNLTRFTMTQLLLITLVMADWDRDIPALKECFDE